MSSLMVDRLVSALASRGLSIHAGDRPGELKLHGPKNLATPSILAALTEFKPLLLERYASPDLPPAEPDRIVLPCGDSEPVPAESTTDDVIRSGTASPARAVVVMGVERGTCAYRRYQLDPGVVYRWEEFRTPEYRVPISKSAFRILLATAYVPMMPSKFAEVFPSAD